MNIGPRPRRLIRISAAVTALGVASLSLAACGGDSGAGDGKVSVAASFYPMAYLAQRIGGDHVQVQNLTKPGTEPHDLELSPKQTGRLSEADMIVYLKGLQPAVDEAVGQSEAGNVAEATSFTTLEKHGTDVHGEEGHGEHGEHEGHDHGDDAAGDPHVWLDPVRYAQIAKGVGKHLQKADPKHKAEYKKNTKELVARLGTLDKEFKDGLKKKKTDTFVTTHAAFGYLAERYGLHEEAVSGIDPESEPSAARMKKLHEVAKEDDVDTVFFENNASDKTARALAGDLRLKTSVLSPLESVKDPKEEDYFSVMHQNLTALKTALGAQ
ncbi:MULTISPECIES: metal ABC transporter substrate-binding protein [unclassified Streptomyces]|uniref:metal ABC transporter substrate-binding protein n=1 Tax=unclassified Streptomyces TaxID=2593676 RepID=UPI002DD9E345|nr:MULTISPECIES: metal ABC transporter substrate-binding protein [unclassified Streptomyces]WSA94849.1 metal ABC transporter substrate-binding protein [Streptomyces sp. NBC_01795]WSB79269.1 metal ABC transporter substrate-binding protein [Streptomyces sp. NBC_01775]WSS41313.1 metal ABC transporter substrate-binding protein [Streptomyces sp. NBC_01187]